MPDSAMWVLHLWLDQETGPRTMHRVYDMSPAELGKWSQIHQQSMDGIDAFAFDAGGLLCLACLFRFP